MISPVAFFSLPQIWRICCVSLLLIFFCQSHFLRSIFCSTLFAMAQDLICFSAQLPHRMCLALRKTEARRTSAPPLPAITQGASGASLRRGSQGWGSSSDADEHHSSRRFTTPWVSSTSHPPPLPGERIPTTPNVQLEPGISSLCLRR